MDCGLGVKMSINPIHFKNCSESHNFVEYSTELIKYLACPSFRAIFCVSAHLLAESKNLTEDTGFYNSDLNKYTCITNKLMNEEKIPPPITCI